MDALSLSCLRAYWGVGEVDLWSHRTALLIIDMQQSCVHNEGYSFRRLRQLSLDRAVAEYRQQLDGALPNLVRLVTRFRERGQVVMHVNLTSIPGRQPGGQANAGRWTPADSFEHQVIDVLKPAGTDLVVLKTGSSGFVGTNADFLLRKLGVESIVVGGVVTNGCVEYTVSNGHDLGYATVVPSDACATLTHELQADALQRLKDRRAHVLTTQELLNSTTIPASVRK